MPRKQLTGKNLKAFRGKVYRLKKAGLLSDKVDPKTQESTSHMRNLVENKFYGFLSGREAAVKVPSRKVAKEFADGFTVRRKTVLVPVEKGQKKPSYKKREGFISAKAHMYGRDFTRIYTPLSGDKINKLPRGKDVRYTIPLGGTFRTEETLEDLEKFMFPYENPPPGSGRRPYENWRKYIIVEKADGGEFDSDENE